MKRKSRRKLPARTETESESPSTRPPTLEDRFEAEWSLRALRGAVLHRQFRFHPQRRFTFDFAFPEVKVAVEIEGFGGKLDQIVGASKDCEKYNLAIECGWVVLRHTARTLGSKENRRLAIEQLRRVILQRQADPQLPIPPKRFPVINLNLNPPARPQPRSGRPNEPDKWN